MLRLQRVIMILSVPFKGRKRKGDCEESALPILYLFVFLSRSVSLLLPLFLLPPHLPTSFVRKCLLNKLTVLWRVISKAQRHSMLMLNLFCIHLRWRGLSTLPSWSYSLPSSSRLRAHTWSLLFVVGNIFSSFFFLPLRLHSCSFPVYKSCNHFSGYACKDVRQRWCSEA